MKAIASAFSNGLTSSQKIRSHSGRLLGDSEVIICVFRQRPGACFSVQTTSEWFALRSLASEAHCPIFTSAFMQKLKLARGTMNQWRRATGSWVAYLSSLWGTGLYHHRLIPPYPPYQR